jgi:hypothetical protein
LYQFQYQRFNEHPARLPKRSHPVTGKAEESRDAFDHRLGLVHYIFFDRQRYGFNFGFHYDRNDAYGKNWRYDGFRPVAGFLITLPWNIRATTNFEFHARHYDGSNSTFHQARRDLETTALFGLAKDLTPNLTLTLEHLWNSNKSTIADYSFNRQVYSLGLTWRYY